MLEASERHRRAHAHRARRRIHRQHRRGLRRQLLRRDRSALLRDLRLETFAPTPQAGVLATPFGKLELELSSPRRILSFPLISTAGKLRAAAMFARRRAAPRRRTSPRPARLARLDRGETVERWGLRTLGETAYHYLLRTGIEPFFYVGAEETSAAFGKALMRHALKWQLLVLPAGMGALCDALAAAARGAHRLPGERRRDARRVGRRASRRRHARGRLRDPRRAGDGDRASWRGSIEARTAPMPRRCATRPTSRSSSATSGRSPCSIRWSRRPDPGRHPIARVRTWSALAPQYVPGGQGAARHPRHRGGAAPSCSSATRPSAIVSELRADAEEVFGRLADPDWIRLYPRAEGDRRHPSRGHYRRMAAFLRRPRKRLFYAGDWLTGSTIEGAVRTGADRRRSWS